MFSTSSHTITMKNNAINTAIKKIINVMLFLQIFSVINEKQKKYCDTQLQKIKKTYSIYKYAHILDSELTLIKIRN